MTLQNVCAARGCGDPAVKEYKGQHYCADCHAELAFSVVDLTPARLDFNLGSVVRGGRFGRAMLDDTPPSWDDAIRAMEG
jgi:hypothetical protein